MNTNFLYSYITVLIIVLIAIFATHVLIKKYKESHILEQLNTAIEQSAGGFDTGSARALEIIDKKHKRGPVNTIDKFTYAYIMDKYMLRADAVSGHTKEKLRMVITDKYRDIAKDIIADPIGTNRLLQTARYNIIADFNIVDIMTDIRNYEIENETARIMPTAAELYIDQFARSDKIENTRDKKPKSRAGFIDNYIKESKHIKNDRQNVHDSALVRDLKETLEKTAEETQYTHTDRAFEIDSEIKNIADAMRRPNALRTLQSVRGGQIIQPYNETESDILNRMWNRAYLAENAGREKEIKEAIVVALGDCIENDSVVCPSGRAARILSSLQYVDNDPSIGAALTVDMYRAQIYDETKKIIDDHIARANASSDNELKKYAESFTDATIQYDQASEHKFKSDVRADIEKNIEQYSKKINKNELDRVLTDCRALVDMF